MEHELERLKKQNIITPVTFSDWAAPVVPVEKCDGSMRICWDYKLTVNRVTKTEVYPIPKIKEMFASFTGEIFQIGLVTCLSADWAGGGVTNVPYRRYAQGTLSIQEASFWGCIGTCSVSVDHGVPFTRPALCMCLHRWYSHDGQGWWETFMQLRRSPEASWRNGHEVEAWEVPFSLIQSGVPRARDLQCRTVTIRSEGGCHHWSTSANKWDWTQIVSRVGQLLRKGFAQSCHCSCSSIPVVHVK